MGYQRRILDQVLDEVFPNLPAIALEGAKGVGKTATAAGRATTSFELDRRERREVLAADLGQIVRADPPVLVDEWQLMPETWDRIRRSVDDDPTGGHYLLTGSATAPPDARIHSGAGRIVSLLMRPLSFAERGVETPTVSLSNLLVGGGPQVEGQTDVVLSRYVDEILRSGFPGIRRIEGRARRMQLDSYISRIVGRELPENGMMVRRPAALLDWLSAYGAATATNAGYSAILDAATAGIGDKPARNTADAYRDHLRRLFILEPLPAWTPTASPLKRLALAPKHHLVDPALAARLARVDAAALLKGLEPGRLGVAGTFLAALFESLVTQSVRVYAEAAEASVSHLRSGDDEREIDLIVEGEGGRVLPIEVKLAVSVGDKDVRHLNWLRETLGDRVVDRVIVTTGSQAYRRKDGVAVVPLALLGP
ncbi:MAG: DUF4143 domain-containing protein [Bifidobacteriaceae bacterium]|jgi:predicted AAA+ superfamily ATPase|nr:DUF4143 domain-containing protein [Bifidobacteriaceae bacterium]